MTRAQRDDPEVQCALERKFFVLFAARCIDPARERITLGVLYYGRSRGGDAISWPMRRRDKFLNPEKERERER